VAATPARHGPGSAARSPSLALPRSCSPLAPTPESPACAPTAAGILLPRDSARAGPTPLRSRPCSVTPPSTPRPGTFVPGQPRTPPSSSASSATNRLLTSPLPLSGLLGLPPSTSSSAGRLSGPRAATPSSSAGTPAPRTCCPGCCACPTAHHAPAGRCSWPPAGLSPPAGPHLVTSARTPAGAAWATTAPGSCSRNTPAAWTSTSSAAPPRPISATRRSRCS